MIYGKNINAYVYMSGDKVRVRATPLQSGKSYPTGMGDCSMIWVAGMNKLCGHIVTIRFVDTIDLTYKIEEDDGYWWCNAFFENDNPSFCSEDEEEIAPGTFGEYLEAFKAP